MHACGHAARTAILFTVARWRKEGFCMDIISSTVIHWEENMNESTKIVHRSKIKGGGEPAHFGMNAAGAARNFHKSFPEYAPTPLVHLEKLASVLGTSDIFVKDESKRFGLNAFKVLGGSYCIGRYIAQRLNIPPDQLSYRQLSGQSIRDKLGNLTFVTATDGNHGRGIAWTAARLGMESVVYMPKGSARERLDNIRALGAHAEITDWNYDDTVRFASRQAEEKGWVLVQDTAWEGYEEIPSWIMEGYTTLALETVEQLKDVRPTHIFLQAGVGAMAGAIAGFFADYYGADCPIISVVEPNHADCIFSTAQADDGRLHRVGGDLDTIMAGLACGEPCSIGWKVLDACATNFLSVPDYIAAKGMRVLGSPLGNDPRIISGESGAVTTGLVVETMANPNMRDLKEQLCLDRHSKILCISTEGDTDKHNYQSIVWDGKYPSS